MIDESKTPAPAETEAEELPADTLDEVAGGLRPLNPQPLPPRHG